METIDVSDEDAAFVLGRGGTTKRKLARVSGARLELHDGKDRRQVGARDRGRPRVSIRAPRITSRTCWRSASAPCTSTPA